MCHFIQHGKGELASVELMGQDVFTSGVVESSLRLRS